MKYFHWLALSIAFTAPAAFAGSLILSDTADIAAYAPKALPDAKLIEAARTSAPFLAGGASYRFGLHLTAAPTAAPNGGLAYQAAALMNDGAGRLFYRQFELLAAGLPRRVTVTGVRDTDLKDMHFSVSTGLEDRLVVVEDAANGVTLAFPLGVGGIDEAVMGSAYRILTPKFQGAFLVRNSVTRARSEPTYYRNRPFMPITTARGAQTAIAFHITILDDEVAQQKGLNYLVRGFESHGCMRLRDKDLMEFFTIVERGADDRLPVAVDSHVWNRNEQGARSAMAGPAAIGHVYPTNTSSFMRVTYFAEPPHYQRDEEEHLVMMDRAPGQPDFRRLDESLSPAEYILLPSGAPAEEADLIDNRYPMP